MKGHAALLLLLLSWSPAQAASGSPGCVPDDIEFLGTTFDSSRENDSAQLGRHITTTLTLQVWQLLVRPPGNHPKTGGVTWDTGSKPPLSQEEAERLAEDACEDPQLLMWGKTWQYGGAYVVEPSIAIRRVSQPSRDVGRPLWSVALPSGKALTMGIPHERVDFDPIIVNADLLRELNDPAKLRLYDAETCTKVVDPFVGDYFSAKQHSRLPKIGDVAIVWRRHGRQPDQGCLRLSGLSLQRSDPVRLSAGLIAFYRNDWRSAQRLLEPIADNPNGRTLIRVDALLYLAVAADHVGLDPLSLIQRAYDLNPYERVVVQYLCMGYVRALGLEARGPRDDVEREEHVEALRQILNTHRLVLPESGEWIAGVRAVADSAGGR